MHKIINKHEDIATLGRDHSSMVEFERVKGMHECQLGKCDTELVFYKDLDEILQEFNWNIFKGTCRPSPTFSTY